MCNFCDERVQRKAQWAILQSQLHNPEWDLKDDGVPYDNKLLENVTDDWCNGGKMVKANVKWVIRRYGNDVYEAVIKANEDIKFELVWDKDEPDQTIAMYYRREVGRAMRSEGYAPIKYKNTSHSRTVWPCILHIIRKRWNRQFGPYQFSCSLKEFCRLLRQDGCAVLYDDLKDILRTIKKKASALDIELDVSYDNRVNLDWSAACPTKIGAIES